MPSDRSIAVRDQLSAIVDELIADTNDQEANILACCVSVAVEELEKYIYKGAFTPSVQPFRPNKKWNMPFKPGEDDDDQFSGPPWAREKKSALAELKVFQRLKAEAEMKPVVVRKQSVFDRLDIDDWTPLMTEAFQNGNAGLFMSEVKAMMPPGTIPLKELTEYLGKMKRAYPHLWAVNKKGMVS